MFKYVCCWTLKDGRKVEGQLYTADKLPDLMNMLEEWDADDICIKKIKTQADILSVRNIKEDLEEAVNDIFLKYQDKLGIEDGGLDFDLDVSLDEKEDELSNIILECLRYQAEPLEDDEE